MTDKKIAISKPKRFNAKSADEWVEKRSGTKRFAVDLPVELHSKLKIESAKTGLPMGDILKSLIEKKVKDNP